MDMSADEVKKFWRDYCQRRRIDAAIVARGESEIAADPDYWADQEMQALLTRVSAKGSSSKPS